MHSELPLSTTFQEGIMKSLLALVVTALLISPAAFGQIFTEDFNYAVGDSLVDHGWNMAGTPSYLNSLLVTGPALAFPGYALSNHGGSTFLAASGQDLFRAFPQVSADQVYLWVMIKVAGAQYYGDYFLGLMTADQSNTTARIYAKSASENGFYLGVGKGSEEPAYSSTELTYGLTYLLVLKYEFKTGSSTNDIMRLFIFQPGSAVPEDEPVTATLGPYTATSVTDVANVSSVLLRQGASWMAPSVFVDGLAISTSWAPALPVQIAYLHAAAISGGKVRIEWQTLSETDNLGFTVEKSVDGTVFTPISGAFVEGHRTTLIPHEYSYTDESAQPGTWYYRLAQMDGNGAIHFTDAVKVEVTTTGVSDNSPTSFGLMQNYPNPFNPSTTVRYQLPVASMVKLVVYDMLGREMATLVNDMQQAGIHQMEYSPNLPSGTYFYRITVTGSDGSTSFSDVKRMTLVK
jgi:hypothetical protein